MRKAEGDEEEEGGEEREETGGRVRKATGSHDWGL